VGRDFLQGIQNLLIGIRTYKQDPMRQLKSYFYRTQKEAGMLENEASRQAGKAHLFGENVVAEGATSRAEQLQGRAETAKAMALEMNPMAFTPQRKPVLYRPPSNAAQFKRRIKSQVAKLYAVKR